MAEMWIEVFQEVSKLLHVNRERLDRLDAAIGDGEHGSTMVKGIEQTLQDLEECQPETPAAVLAQAGASFAQAAGGAAGALYASFFLAMANIVRKDEHGAFSTAILASMLGSGIGIIKKRGKAEVGDKTMIDTLVPALEAVKKGEKQNLPLSEVIPRTLAAAKAGMLSTIPMEPKRGRAGYLGERAVGHQDPGATSAYLILKALHDVYMRRS